MSDSVGILDFLQSLSTWGEIFGEIEEILLANVRRANTARSCSVKSKAPVEWVLLWSQLKRGPLYILED